MYLHELKIGNVTLKNNLILAPMAGITDLPFRIIVEKFNPGLVCTEMVSAKALYYGDEKTKKLLKTEGEVHPISMQIFGNEPEIMGFAALIITVIFSLQRDCITGLLFLTAVSRFLITKMLLFLLQQKLRTVLLSL